MGNKFTKSSSDSKFTKPTGLYPTCEWDDKTVKKMINKKKVAPRYPGREGPGVELDECPICFLVSTAVASCQYLFSISMAVLVYSSSLLPTLSAHLVTQRKCIAVSLVCAAIYERSS